MELLTCPIIVLPTRPSSQCLPGWPLSSRPARVYVEFPIVRAACTRTTMNTSSLQLFPAETLLLLAAFQVDKPGPFLIINVRIRSPTFTFKTRLLRDENAGCLLSTSNPPYAFCAAFAICCLVSTYVGSTPVAASAGLARIVLCRRSLYIVLRVMMSQYGTQLKRRCRRGTACSSHLSQQPYTLNTVAYANSVDIARSANGFPADRLPVVVVCS